MESKPFYEFKFTYFHILTQLFISRVNLSSKSAQTQLKLSSNSAQTQLKLSSNSAKNQLKHFIKMLAQLCYVCNLVGQACPSHTWPEFASLGKIDGLISNRLAAGCLVHTRHKPLAHAHCTAGHRKENRRRPISQSKH